ncbi:MAG: hypothetical protein N2691_03900 [Patescibacteria group bacterium]|nr:hypothetical protein [Patescibacteria group bacterium]
MAKEQEVTQGQEVTDNREHGLMPYSYEVQKHIAVANPKFALAIPRLPGYNGLFVVWPHEFYAIGISELFGRWNSVPEEGYNAYPNIRGAIFYTQSYQGDHLKQLPPWVRAMMVCGPELLVTRNQRIREKIWNLAHERLITPTSEGLLRIQPASGRARAPFLSEVMALMRGDC